MSRRLGTLAGSLLVAGCVALAGRCSGVLPHGSGGTTTAPSATSSSAAPSSTAPSAATATPSTQPPATTPGAPPAGTALAALALLPVRAPGPATGYSREAFGAPYTDDLDATVDGARNGCDQRNDIRRRDGRDVVIRPRTGGCVVTSATVLDPYTGLLIPLSATQFEHVVALKNAWLTGARSLTAAERADLAGDPLNLLLVSGSQNASKGEKSAATWLPPNAAYRCPYVARQIAVKTRYRLWVTSAEKERMTAVLQGCPAQTLPSPASVAVPPPKP